MYNFHVRFAQTGHVSIYKQINSIEALQNIISKQYKIQVAHQKFIAKGGHLVGPNSKLDDQQVMKKTFTKDHSNPDLMEEGAISLFMFNHKDLLKNQVENTNIATLNFQGKGVLGSKHENFGRLNSKVYELQPISNKFSNQEIVRIFSYNQMLTEMANSWHESAIQFKNIHDSFKQNSNCFEQYTGFWENQRKAISILYRNLQLVTADNQKQIKYLQNLISSFEKNFQAVCSAYGLNQSLESSSFSKSKQNCFFQAKNMQERLRNSKKLYKSIEILHNSLNRKISQSRKNSKRVHNELQINIKQIDEFRKKKCHQLSKYLDQLKDNYVRLTEAMRQKLDTGDDGKLLSVLAGRKNVQSNIMEYMKIGEQYLKQSEEKFYQLFRYYKSHESMVIAQYRKYIDAYTQLKQSMKAAPRKIDDQISSLHKILKELETKGKQIAKQRDEINIKSTKIKQFQQSQIKRRQHFNMKLILIQQQIKQIMKEQQTQRKLYIAEMMSIEELYDHPILTNIRVPCFLLNYDETSDRQLPADSSNTKSKNALRNSLNMMQQNNFQTNMQYYKGSSGMDKVLKELQFLKNCQITLKKDDYTNEAKVKNIQTILQKSADVFHHIYVQKLNLITKQHQSKQRSYINTINTLDKENKHLRQQIFSYSKDNSTQMQEKKQLINQVAKLENYASMLLGEKAHLQNKLKDVTQQNQRKTKEFQYLLQQGKKQIAKVKQQKKDIEQAINKQVGNTMETLLQQLQKSDTRIKELEQLNHEYKVAMGDQQIRIVTLQTQLKIRKQQEGNQNINQNMSLGAINSSLKDSFYGIPLKVDSMADKNNRKSQNIVKVDGEQEENEQNPQLLKKITNEQIKQIQRQISKLQKQIQELKQQNDQLRTQNTNLNEEILKIAMKDIEDQQIQTQHQQKQQELKKDEWQNEQQMIDMPRQLGTMMEGRGVMTQVIHNLQQYIRVQQNPRVGQLRIFIPFSSGLYVAIKSNKCAVHGEATSLDYGSSLRRNNLGLSSYPTEVHGYEESQWPYVLDMNCLTGKARELLTQCTLVVVLKVNKILPGADRFYVEGDIISAVGFEDQDLITKDYGPFLRN